MAALLALVLALPACSTVPSNSPDRADHAGAGPSGRRDRHRAARAGAGGDPRRHRAGLHRGRGQHPAGPSRGARAPGPRVGRHVVGRGRDHDHQLRLRDGHDRRRARWRCRRTSSGPSTSAASSPSAGRSAFRREFTLEQVEGEWRISNPEDGLIILEPDFERLYDERAAYFLDPTGQRVVPDPAPPHPGRGAADRAGAAPARGPVGRARRRGATTRWAASSCAPRSPSAGRRPPST